MPDHEFDEEVVALKRLQGKVASAANRLAWRAAQQRRMSRVASILRTLSSIVTPHTFTRSRHRAGWLVTVTEAGREEPILEVVTRTRGRTLDQLNESILIRIIRPDMIMIARLRELASSGLIIFAPAEGVA